jgi:hypothetical protein
MAELLQTERTYVKDLETCINVSFNLSLASLVLESFFEDRKHYSYVVQKKMLLCRIS